MVKKLFNLLKKLPKTMLAHKLISGAVIIVVIVGGYFGYKAIFKKTAETKYMLASVERGTLIVSVSGSGQVSATNQLDVNPKTSGDVVYIGVQNGQEVKSGTLLVQLDATDARKTVRDAEISLENAQITLSKLKTSQETSLSDIHDSIETTQKNLDQAYQNGFNTVVNAFLDLPNVLQGLNAVLYDNDVASPDTKMNTAAYQDLVVGTINSTTVDTMVIKAISEYTEASVKYNQNLTDYRNANRFSPSEKIIALIDQTLETVKTMAQLVKDEQNLVDTVVTSLQYRSKTVPAALTQYQSDISGYISKLNSHLSSLNSVVSTIDSNQRSLETYRRSLNNTTQNNPLDLRSQENAVEQKKDALQDAKDALANYYIRAPFDGVVAAMNVEKGDTVSNGTSVVTLITKQRVAKISLNEVDVAQVKAGQKVNLAFDAIEDLTISGKILEVDSIGTTTQGVVTYEVTIGFDTQDERIKPGMSVSAVIITEAKQGVLMVSNSAIKTSGDFSYVEMPSKEVVIDSTSRAGITLNSVVQQQIETGIANDSYTEILSGLGEGDTVIAQTINSGTINATTQGGNNFRMPGMGGGFRN